jgi:dimethylamine corrinoid protein
MNTIITGLSSAVTTFDEAKAVQLCRKGMTERISAEKMLSRGLAAGMKTAGEKFENGEFFVPELLLASDVMQAGIDVLRPALAAEVAGDNNNAKIVIGVIEGDIHDIGKNLVKIMLDAAGYKIIDLGSDVTPRRFLDAAVSEKAEIVCLSSLVSTTMLRLGEVIKLMQKEGLRDDFIVMAGGASVSPGYARFIGADGYAPNAAAAVRKARLLLIRKSRNIAASGG